MVLGFSESLINVDNSKVYGKNFEVNFENYKK